MPELTRKHLHFFLDRLAARLDISESLRQRAEDRFSSVAAWLSREESSVRVFSPEIYPQGSFKLGTVVRPVVESDAYDVDLVCTLNLSKKSTSQQYLKTIVGNEIRAYARANSIVVPPKNGKRCWTLEYSDEAQFHMDILPSVPDGETIRRLLEVRQLTSTWTENGIAITDKTMPSYPVISDDWPRSNPKGYADWFYGRMRTRFDDERRFLAESSERNIEEIPEFRVKTPLQRAIQILKRHRDLMFVNDQEDKPISIIITTLAAHAYNNEVDITEALYNIIRGMPGHIESRNGEPWVPNPSYPIENFADKWRSKPAKKKKFYTWLKKAESDLSEAFRAGDVKMLGERLKPRLGDKVVKEAVADVEKEYSRKGFGLIVPASGLPSPFDVPHKERPRWEMRPRYWVNIKAYYFKGGFRPRLLISNDKPLPKHASLRFEEQTNAPRPYDIYWQVVNTGKEASDANSLRGTFYECHIYKGKRVRNESTLYKGTHWIECFIVKDGICVANSEEFVVNIE